MRNYETRAWRCAVAAFGFVVIGLVVSVAATWLIAVTVPLDDGAWDGGSETIFFDHEQWLIATWGRFGTTRCAIVRLDPNEWHAFQIERGEDCPSWVTIEPEWKRLPTYFPGIPFPVMFEARGWPWRAFVCEYRFEVTPKTDIWWSVAANGVALPPFKYNRHPGIVSLPRTIPVKPIWYGLVADTAFLGICCFTVVALWRLLRRLVRRARKRCPICGYPQLPQQMHICPECGYTHG